MSEKKTAPVEEMEFKAEVKQMLDIVIHSLYTDRQIFVRELISNASDALEKMRLKKLLNDTAPAEGELEIQIETNEEANTFIIRDNGIGMTKKELIDNLGTIARSGSKNFIEQMKESDKMPAAELIGQFGVGFYSGFMVADKVTVTTMSQGASAWVWTSEGVGSFTLEKGEKATAGTEIVLYLKEDAKEFAKESKIKEIINEYSNFVPFPIQLGEEKVNTVEALWKKNRNEIDEKEYEEFYRFISHNYDKPHFTMHFSADAPLAINALLFVPTENKEKFFYDRLTSTVSLYCKKVLIKRDMEDLLPEWLRFLTGVIDSEDIPLNISRETMQDTLLIKKISRVITRRFLKFLKEKATKDNEQYMEFWSRFSGFIKEGIINDEEYRKDLTDLLRLESTTLEAGKTTSLAEYTERLKEGQEQIYYLTGRNRETVEKSPFLQAFKDRDLEVILTYENTDDFVMTHISEFDGKKLVSADSPNVKFPGEEEKKDSEALTELRGWMKTAFGDRITEVKTANRLLTVPAVVVTMDGHMTIRMQRIMMEHNKGMGLFSRFALEINPEHAIIKRLDTLKDENSKLAELISHQILDNALHTEGLLQDPEQSTSRITHLLGQLIDVEIPYEEPEPVVKATPDFSKMAGLEGLQGLEGLEGLEGLGDNLKDSLAEAINNQTEEAPIDVTAEVADESADTKKEEKKEESTTA